MLIAACQPVTPTTVNSKATSAITLAPGGQTEIDLVVSAVTKGADNETDPGTVSDTNSSSGINNGTEEKVIATISVTPQVQPAQVQPTQVQPELIQPPFRPKAMIGSASIILVRDLGIATMIRQEGPIDIWQYRFASCVVDFFFHPASQASSKLIIKEWDMRSVVIGGKVNEGKCLAAMDRHHQKLIDGS